ncbi:DNA-processing protein DprA [Chitinophaga sp.]|uniref:DNA-processing protein DprA n=1 Tax=Chitinophaga sp. TaxID=1869181 RepID=UPI0031E455EF
MRDKNFDILFLTYLTGYSIAEIYKGLQYENVEDFIDDYRRYKQERSENVSNISLFELLQITSERYEEMKFRGIRFVKIGDNDYPKQLESIRNPPPLLFIKGNLPQNKNIAVIGTREISSFASKTVSHVVKVFSEQQYGIISGLAYGIDKLAHESALSNKAYTLAILPNALDHIYPKDHLSLANRIIESGGGIMTELPLGINLGKKGFVQRNRLQTGISDIVMPIEMGLKSGTMHSVQFCIQQKRRLFIIRPDPSYSNLAAYEGIRVLLEDKYENLSILDQNFNYDDVVKKLDERKYGNQKINSNNNIKFTDIPSDKIRKNNILDDIMNEMMSYGIEYINHNLKYKGSHFLRENINNINKELTARFQNIAFKYIQQYSFLSKKDIEKIIVFVMNTGIKKIEQLTKNGD